MVHKFIHFGKVKMPAYLKLCLDTWKFKFTILTYQNVEKFTDPIPAKLKQLSLPKVADYIRVHVLRDSGGYWLDTDTIMLTDILPNESILGDNKTRGNTIGYLCNVSHSSFFHAWADYQEQILNKLSINTNKTTWDIMGNAFTNKYLKEHPEIVIGNLSTHWPETYMITGDIPRPQKYEKFYFQENYTLDDLPHETGMLMLHNSWTPVSYKSLNKQDVFAQKCTLSNILRALLHEV